MTAEDVISRYLYPEESVSSTHVPFWWQVGRKRLRSAIEVFSVDPGLGSLLIYGEPGTGKSSALRTACALLPGARVYAGCVNLCGPDDEVVCDTCAQRVEKHVIQVPLRSYEVPLIHDVSDPDWRKKRAEEITARSKRGLLIFHPLNHYDPGLVVRLCHKANPTSLEGSSRIAVAGSYDLNVGEALPLMAMNFTLGVKLEMREDLEERTEIIRRSKGVLTGESSESDLEFRRVVQRVRDARDIVSETGFSDAMMKRVGEICQRFTERVKFKLDPAPLRVQFTRVCRAYAALLGKRWVTPSEIYESACMMFTHRMEAMGLQMHAASPTGKG